MSKCLWCDGELREILDLGSQPLANSLLRSQYEPEMTYPLIFTQCERCRLSQCVRFDYKPFGEDYPYFSSVSESYVRQCRELAEHLLTHFKPKSVLEIGCNDGVMLQNFKHLEHKGYEPSAGPCRAAKEKGLYVSSCYFTEAAPTKYDLILAFNVVAHTPDLRKMITAMRDSLEDHGNIIIEVQDLSKLLSRGYFDTIYHEHYSYFEQNSIQTLFAAEGLFLIYVQNIPSHGGSKRYWFQKEKPAPEYAGKPAETTWADYSGLKAQAHNTRARVQDFMTMQPYLWEKTALFGAPAKGNTLLNYCGVSKEDVLFAVDETPAKQGKFLPGSRIPVFDLDRLTEKKPGQCVIMPWNFEESIRQKLSKLNSWGMRVMTPYAL